MNSLSIRAESLAQLKSKRWPEKTNLPLLDQAVLMVSIEACVGRAIALLGVIAASYGYPKDAVKNWIVKQNCEPALSAKERAFLESGDQFSRYFQCQPDCLLMLAWALQKIESVDFLAACPSDLVEKFPDIRNNESSKSWGEKTAMRSIKEVLGVADLLYVAHSCAVDDLAGARMTARAQIEVSLRERRRAIEWILGWGGWDNLLLDT
jgi:Domain of unknown function (DUF4272)